MSEAIDLLAENAAENATSRTTLCCFVPFIKSMLEDVSVYTSVQLRIIFRLDATANCLIRD